MDLLNLIMLIAYVVGLLLAVVRIIGRRVRYLLAGESAPALLTRDLIFVGGLAFPFLAILTVRTLNSFFPDMGLSAMLAGNQTWYIFTGLPAIIAVYYFVYFEYFRIERNRR